MFAAVSKITGSHQNNASGGRNDTEPAGGTTVQPTTTSILAPPKFDDVQTNAIRMALDGKNIYIGGKPGAGKSHCSCEIVRQLRSQGKHVEFISYMWVTASNAGEGCRSSHAFMDQGLMDRSIQTYTNPANKEFKDIVAATGETDVLAIEELNLFPVPWLIKLEIIIRETRAQKNPRAAGMPWGGLQIVANGDVKQAMKLRQAGDRDWDGYAGVDYVFQMPCFNDWFDAAVMLKQIYRTSDRDYALFLQELGDGNISEDHRQKLMACVGKPVPDDAVGLYWSNKEVNAGNMAYLASLPGEPVHFQGKQALSKDAVAKCGAENVDDAFDRLRKRLHSDSEVPGVELKCGADVFCTANVDPSTGVHNGRRGVVIGFLNKGDAVPEGVNSASGKERVKEDAAIVQYDNGTVMAMEPHKFSEDISAANGKRQKWPCQASCTVIPLRLARCMTFSKCIGMEMSSIMVMLVSPDVYVNLAYIALGRCIRGWDGLHLPLDFDLRSLRMDTACLAFDKELESKMDHLNVVVLRDASSKQNTFAIMNSLYADIDDKEIPGPPADEENPFMAIQPTKISLKMGRKRTERMFTHIMLEPGHVAVVPKFERFYEMVGFADGENWLRDSVRYSTSSKTSTNKPGKQYIGAWGADAKVWRKGCGGALVCTQEGCTYAATLRNKQGLDTSDRKCPVHKTRLEPSGPCSAVFYQAAEICDDVGKQRHGIVTVEQDHCHGPWAVSGLLATSKTIIDNAVHSNPNIGYRDLVTGLGVPGHDPSKGALTRIDPAFSNMGQVTKQMQRARKANGGAPVEAGFVAMAQQAARDLGQVDYIKTDIQLLKGLTPMVICATDQQLYFYCSPKHFLTHMVDFTFDEVLVLDDWDDHAVDFDLGITLCFWRVYAKKKSAEATEFYLYHLVKELRRRGFTFKWGESITCQIVDFHYGQALGFLRHLMWFFGSEEEGVAMFRQLLTGCGTHLKKVSLV